MDYIEGTDAARLVRDRYPHGMPTRDVCKIVSAIADALDYAHQRYLLHRDVKPANILLTDPRAGERRILLADFGIARAANDSNVVAHRRTTLTALAAAEVATVSGVALIGRRACFGLRQCGSRCRPR
jgi:serine/threonine-protein kinase